MGYEYDIIDGHRVEVSVAARFRRLAEAFKRETGYDLHVESGTRTRQEQQELWDSYQNGTGNLAAYPGTSNHEEDGPVGPRALDLSDSGADAGVSVRGSERDLWMEQNAEKYGFTNAGYGFSQVEAWHKEAIGDLGGNGGSNGGFVPARDVADIQRIVGAEPDGIYGPDTQARVAGKQRELGVADDGLWGSGTEAAYVASQSHSSRPSGKSADELSYADIQEALVRKGYQIAVDNDWGPQSHDALGDFQSRNGLDVDYVCGAMTWDLLNTW